MSIADWPEDQRPREKLLARGAASLSDAELLAIFLRTGIRGKSAVDLARELLAHFDGSLSHLFAATPQAFSAVPGLGLAKYSQLAATRELAERAMAERLFAGDVMNSPDVVRDYLRLRLHRREREVFVALCLSAQNQVLAMEELFQGSLTESRVYPREVARLALARNAAAVIIAHNHPSGSAKASEADIQLTRQLEQALALIDVRLLDHILVAGHQALSFAEQGWM
ncbi:RadC family protein [Rivihabitans pingtungensis]|uniref:DNA replication and repair protein RadC n=1 Tax=Rivihabitans pingtungensis TaxID=1054498 RepID=A0A318KIN3_9NEIS|nr:DNA repair protein RadC [Rivihabitans pingtungensis]PXX77964.1 DNA replication and repair protein RadC [Rivihabitans pingtungensis]